MSTVNISAFAYRAQTHASEPISGTIDAGSLDDASRRLAAMQLRVIEINPVQVPSIKPRALRGQDFLAFNTQLAHLTTAGLPVEQGLRLIAEDMRSKRLAETVKQIANDLEGGQSLQQAFEKHATDFPPLYGQLISAGVRSGNLPAMLLNLGRHVELVTRLRATLWGALSYPAVVMVSMLTILIGLSVTVFPKFNLIFQDFRTELPFITRLVMGFSSLLIDNSAVLLTLLIVLIVGTPIVWKLLRILKLDQQVAEAVLFPLPLIGSSLRRNLLARWCDALKLGVEGGLDLPAAIALASDAVGSPGLKKDAAAMVDSIQAGRPLNEKIPTRLMPPSVITVISLAASNNDLSGALGTLSQMYQQQAEIKIAMIPAIVTPALVIFIALCVATIVLAMFAPMISLVQAISGMGSSGHHWFW